MILKELAVHNFGAYRGEHRLNLAPISRSQPVVLIGAMNGSGKTTLLDAILLCLYGKRAPVSGRSGRRYEDYLTAMISRGVPVSEGSSIALTMSVRRGGGQQELRIERLWRARGTALGERLQVLRDGFVDSVLTDHWDERVEEFLPVRLASLFFFDGEKVADLADLSRSQQMLADAINRLLGLDRVEQLAADLRLIERRKRAELGQGNQELEGLSEAERQLDALRAALRTAREERGGLNVRLERARMALRKSEDELRSEGGHLYEDRRTLEQDRQRATDSLAKVRAELLSLAGDCGPLLLLRADLARLRAQAELEADRERAGLLADLIAKRDERSLALLRESGAGNDCLAAMEAFWRAEQDVLAARTAGESYVQATPQATIQISHLVDRGLPLAAERVRALLADAEILAERVTSLDRSLESVPDESRVAARIRDRDACRAEVHRLEGQVTSSDELLARLLRDVERSAAQRDRLHNERVSAVFDAEDTRRIVEHSQRARTTLRAFRHLITDRHISRIAAYALESFQHLLRKSRLVSKLCIDAESYEVSLWNESGHRIPADRLSAGERQLLAVSLLWGLARASGMTLPTMIDTPLGRLDSTHRTNLVEGYFPFAGHQVILLSTDEEINERYYPMLKPWTGREYTLVHDGQTDSTSIESGYFWEVA